MTIASPAVSRPRLPALTSLRFLAALHVCLFHIYSMKALSASGIWTFERVGYVGVSFFFVLSGFILVYTYGDRDFTRKDFWQARFARIYPAYAFSLLVNMPFFFFACLTVKGRAMHFPFYEWSTRHFALSVASVLLLVQSWIPNNALAWNGPAWSLSCEAFFYLLFPFALLRMKSFDSRKLLALAATAWLIVLGLCASYAMFHPDGVAQVDDSSLNLVWLNVVKFNPLMRLPEFIVGMTAGVFFLRGKFSGRWANGIVFAGVAGAATAIATYRFIPYPVLHTALLTPAFAAIIVGVALRPKWTSLLAFRPFEVLGEISYSFYLLHILVIAMWFIGKDGKPIHNTPSGIAIGISVPILLALGVYYGIERPLRKKLAPKTKRPAAVVPTLETAAVGAAATN